MPCMDWLCNAVCYCGCQANGLQRRFVPDAAPFPALNNSRPVRSIGLYMMNWDSPAWLSITTQAVLDGVLAIDCDPAASLVWERELPEWDGRKVTEEEFNALCIAENTKHDAELAEHMRESKRNLLRFARAEGDSRFFVNSSFTSLGELMAITLSHKQEPAQ